MALKDSPGRPQEAKLLEAQPSQVKGGGLGQEDPRECQTLHQNPGTVLEHLQVVSVKEKAL